MNETPLRMRLGILTACLIGAGMVATGCSDDEAAEAPATPDASTGTDAQSEPPADGGTTPTVDSGEEIITDGGGLLPEDPDAGILDEDAGVDGGVACGLLTTGAYVTSSCSNRASLFVGGTLTTADYQLKAVTVLGDKVFCAGTFLPYSHRAGLKVTASSPTTATLELLELYGKTGAIGKTGKRYDATVVAAGNTLTYTPTACGKAAPATATYSIGTEVGTGKAQILLRLPYGKGQAIYRFAAP